MLWLHFSMFLRFLTSRSKLTILVELNNVITTCHFLHLLFMVVATLRKHKFSSTFSLMAFELFTKPFKSALSLYYRLERLSRRKIQKQLLKNVVYRRNFCGKCVFWWCWWSKGFQHSRYTWLLSVDLHPFFSCFCFPPNIESRSIPMLSNSSALWCIALLWGMGETGSF